MKANIRGQGADDRRQTTDDRRPEAKCQMPEVSVSAIAWATAEGQRSEYAPRSTLHAPRAFTLVELLVVISIIAILLGIIVPTYWSVREKAKYTKAKVTVKNLETAFKAYLDHYRVWPSVFADDSTTLEIKDDIYRILKGEKVGNDNKDSIAFYEFEATNSTAGALDPWSDPSDSTTWKTYRVRVDKNYNNKIDDLDLYRSVIVWSPGADRTNNTADDVKSWD